MRHGILPIAERDGAAYRPRSSRQDESFFRSIFYRNPLNCRILGLHNRGHLVFHKCTPQSKRPLHRHIKICAKRDKHRYSGVD